MTPFDAACRRWRPHVVRAVPAAADDFIDELTSHLAQRWLDALAQGRTEADADRLARAELSAWAGVRPPARPAPGHPFAGSALDWRFALRMLAWRPSFTVGAMVLIAVAIGSASALTAVLYGVLGRPLPYPLADRLVTVWQSGRDGISQVSYPDYRDLRASGAFEATAAFMGGTGTLSGGMAVARVNALFVEPEMLSMLGARPHRGRLLTPADAAAQVALISHRLWRTQFGSDEAIVGRTLSLSGRPPVTIVGVLEAGFDFELPVARTFLLANHDVWLPLDTSDPTAARRNVSTYQVLARLAPGIALDDARAAAARVAAMLATAHPATNRERTFDVVPLHDVMVDDARQPLWIAAAGGVILVLAALANLGGLALARFASRQGELAVRHALGASRLHVLRQIVTEQVPPVLGGGLLGVLAGQAATAAAASASSVRLPRPDAIAFDGPAWLAAAIVGALAAVVLSGVPLALAGRAALSSGGPTRIAGHASRRPRRWLVASEITLALVLCSAAALVSLTLVRLLTVDPGFATTGRLTFRVSAYAAPYPGQRETVDFFARLTQRIRTLPGVDEVAAGSSLPLSGQYTGSHVLSDPTGLATSDPTVAGWQLATPGFFPATGTPILSGRDFTADDQIHDRHVTILNATLARALFGDADPVGRRVRAGGGDHWHEVIGVAGDVRHRSLRETAAPRLYDLVGPHFSRTMYVVVKSRSDDAGGLHDAVIRAVAAIDAEAPVFEVATVDALLARAVGPERLASLVATGIGALALLLAAFGVHAVVACSVAEREREMGVRLALGSTRGGVMRLVLGEAGAMVVAGGLAGLALAAGAARVLASHLHGLDASDVWRIIGVVGSAVALAAVGAALPAARRAASVDPVTVLRG